MLFVELFDLTDSLFGLLRAIQGDQRLLLIGGEIDLSQRADRHRELLGLAGVERDVAACQVFLEITRRPAEELGVFVGLKLGENGRAKRGLQFSIGLVLGPGNESL